MSGAALKAQRMQRGWSQAELAARLGVSQPYVAMFEGNKRRVPENLLRKLCRLFALSPTCLPAKVPPVRVSADKLAQELAALDYPGFAYLRGTWKKNPAEVLVAALCQPNLDSRVAEALPWLLLQYPTMDSEWLVSQARLRNLSNRLGFVVDLAMRVLERRGEANSPRYLAFTTLADNLRESRLAKEDTFCQESLSDSERNWLRENRPPEAAYWQLLTDWRPEHLRYAA